MAIRQRTSKQSWLIGGLVVLSAVNAALSAVAMKRGVSISESTHMLWYFVFSILVAVWLKNDMSEAEPAASSNYPHFVIFLFWPVLLPYHLLRSRGIEGLVLFVGFVATYIAPYFVQLVMWAEHAS
jgi:hypothetical protein